MRYHFDLLRIWFSDLLTVFSCCSLARCGPTWILSINSMTLSSGMPLNGRILWRTRKKIRQRGENQRRLVPDDSPLTPLSKTRGTICLLVNGRWFPWLEL